MMWTGRSVAVTDYVVSGQFLAGKPSDVSRRRHFAFLRPCQIIRESLETRNESAAEKLSKRHRITVHPAPRFDSLSSAGR